MKDNPKVRVTVDLTAELNERLERLTAIIGASSKADTIRDALRVLEHFADRHMQGYEFLETKKGTGSPKPIDLFQQRAVLAPGMKASV